MPASWRLAPLSPFLRKAIRGRSVHRPHYRSRGELALVLALALAVSSLAPAQRGARAETRQPLQLEVYINDTPTELVGSFVRMSNGRIAAESSELGELGLKAQPASGAGTLIVIDDLPGVTYRYDEPNQKIYLVARDEQRISKVYDARAGMDKPIVVQNEYGAVLNYMLFGATQTQAGKNPLGFSGANATVDARFFSPYGTLTQTGIIGTTTGRESDALRLETAFTYSDP